MLSMIALATTSAATYLVWSLFAETDYGRGVGLLVFGIPTAICSYLLVAQRLRDSAVSGWFSLFWIPLNAFEGQIRAALTIAALLVLCGIPGTAGANKFGNDPLA